MTTSSDKEWIAQRLVEAELSAMAQAVARLVEAGLPPDEAEEIAEDLSAALAEAWSASVKRLQALTGKRPITRELPGATRRQLYEAYRAMSDEARYRPAAPSDGFGNIAVPYDELDLASEQRKYADRWHKEESAMEFWLGCCDFRHRPATVYAVEAVRNMNGGDSARPVAVRLLRMALESLEELGDPSE